MPPFSIFSGIPLKLIMALKLGRSGLVFSSGGVSISTFRLGTLETSLMLPLPLAVTGAFLATRLLMLLLSNSIVRLLEVLTVNLSILASIFSGSVKVPFTTTLLRVYSLGLVVMLALFCRMISPLSVVPLFNFSPTGCFTLSVGFLSM